MFRPPPWLPFIEYVLMALEHPPDMFVSRLAACCTMLFLTRSDPELLRSLCHKWAIRFSKDRDTLVARIRRRAREFQSPPIRSLSSNDGVSNLPPGPKLCDPDECVEHFLRLVNTLVPMYFSWNWHRTEDVININKEYEVYVRQNILPMCMSTDPEEDVSDEDESFSIFPERLSPCSSEHIFGFTTKVPGGQPDGETKGGSLNFHRLTFTTIGNISERLQKSPNGLVLVFHARFSAKSCEALHIFEDILKKELLDPVPTVSVVHVVAEPELANMFNISWFPTIIYVPPLERGDPNHSLGKEGRPPSENNSMEVISSLSVRSDKSTNNNAFRMAVLRNSGPSISEALYGVPSDPGSPSSTLHGFCTNEEEIYTIIGKGDYRFYPANAVITIPALVEWINNKGLSRPRTKDDEDCVSRIKVLREGQKFRKCREMVSAIVMLRQLQCSSVEHCRLVEGEAPVFIFMGGGMAAGKSTAATALSRSLWWEKNKADIVLVNADDFKVAMTPWSEGAKTMHESSTRAAEKLLVRAINQGRNIVFDSTMMWRPFIEQVISMVRNAHTTLYQQGVGYKENGAIEEYFKPLEPRSRPLANPYEVRFLAITVEPEIAIPRGILRWFSTGRGVPIPMQLRSFRLFAENFERYIELVDSATLFNNNVFADLTKGELPPVLAEKTEEGMLIHDEEAYALFMRHRHLNEGAENNLELYSCN
ncbi:hypothetical protein C3747_130g44 [Trypanosoma cruzi]|uniref:Zeta toxin domain-containing protein n=2 Tax=Trypanosoma cruzi TaxID=5693 RepID=Q4DIQ5_TRYCC|nr:hypothetical protein, conserved [Trypanosoma cruzi]EAN92405.1 hypothetical protein, conserved [Trypanosoma cruzi]PWV05485.1 hypothetical protein C3747_130g44 [Trypanosoma cruzi]RNC56927.1 hypothetical protein TcCL_ESM05497 [Trypanosoma cruzi]|eukprot:XP_814256.1 hypothetical protein [Trypanosoma cruzi strain CL Brener]